MPASPHHPVCIGGPLVLARLSLLHKVVFRYSSITGSHAQSNNGRFLRPLRPRLASFRPWTEPCWHGTETDLVAHHGQSAAIDFAIASLSIRHVLRTLQGSRSKRRSRGV